MKDVITLMEQCRSLGATLLPMGNQLRVRAPHPLPEVVVAELREAKAEVLAELQRQQRHQQSQSWMLEEWRRTAIPAWRRILKESIQIGNAKREEYAHWMLGEVLKDDEYRETDR